MDPASSLYTRQQLGHLAKLDDTTLNYWSREGLLIPTEGGKGRGSHRRFDFIQVNIAAILAHLRPFGLNIGVMRSLANVLQVAANIGSKRNLHPGNYTTAASLADKLQRFREGDAVMVPKNPDHPPPNLKRAEYIEWISAKRPVNSEAEIIEDFFEIRQDHDSPEAILAFAEKIGPGRWLECQLYAELVYDILAPGYSDEYSWLLGFGLGDSWRIEFGSEGGKFFERLGGPSAEDFGAGIFLPVSGIIRKTWGLKQPSEYMRDRQAETVCELLAEAGIHAAVSPMAEGFKINAPGVEWSLVEAALARYRNFTLEDVTSKEIER